MCASDMPSLQGDGEGTLISMGGGVQITGLEIRCMA